MKLIVWKDKYSVGVPELDEQHKGLIALIDRLTRVSDRAGMAETVNAFLRNWLINHILKTDMDYKPVLGK